MTRYARGLALVGLLALGMGVQSRADDEDEKHILEARKGLLALAKDSEAGKLNAAALAAFRKKHGDLLHAMTIHKPTTKKGLGYEQWLLKLGGRGFPAKMELQTKQAELIQMGHVVLVMSEVTKLYPFPKNPNKKGKKDWDKHNDDQKKAVMEFLDAVKKLDPKGVKTATENINSACNLCHSDFRDS